MPVLMRCLLFVSFLLVILGGCKKTPTATSASYVTGQKTEVKQVTQHPDQGSKQDSTDPGPNSADARPPWPRRMGEFSATSRNRIPSFPLALSGYRSEAGKDFEGKFYPTRGFIRVENGSEWKGLRHFPRTKNGCSSGLFMLRWRLSDPAIHVYSTIDNPRKSTANVATGSYGYMYGSVCDKPEFKFASASKPNWSNLVDVFYEVKFWEATP